MLLCGAVRYYVTVSTDRYSLGHRWRCHTICSTYSRAPQYCIFIILYVNNVTSVSTRRWNLMHFFAYFIFNPTVYGYATSDRLYTVTEY